MGGLGENRPKRWTLPTARSKPILAAGSPSAERELGSFCLIMYKVHHQVKHPPEMQQGGGTHGDPEPSRISVLFSALPAEHRLCCLDHNPNAALRTRTIALIRPHTARQLKTHLIFSPLRYCFSVISLFTAQPNSSSNYYPGTRGLGECSQNTMSGVCAPSHRMERGNRQGPKCRCPIYRPNTHQEHEKSHYRNLQTISNTDQGFIFVWLGFFNNKNKTAVF